MIRSWKGHAAREAFNGATPRDFSRDVASATRKRLLQLNDAETVEQMREPPGNRLNRLKADREGQWSIRVNDQFRLCFSWGAEGPEDVELVDYH